LNVDPDGSDVVSLEQGSTALIGRAFSDRRRFAQSSATRSRNAANLLRQRLSVSSARARLAFKSTIGSG
jgi:hypothetical protein